MVVCHSRRTICVRSLQVCTYAPQAGSVALACLTASTNFQSRMYMEVVRWCGAFAPSTLRQSCLHGVPEKLVVQRRRWTKKENGTPGGADQSTAWKGRRRSESSKLRLARIASSWKHCKIKHFFSTLGLLRSKQRRLADDQQDTHHSGRFRTLMLRNLDSGCLTGSLSALPLLLLLWLNGT